MYAVILFCGAVMSGNLQYHTNDLDSAVQSQRSQVERASSRTCKDKTTPNLRLYDLEEDTLLTTAHSVGDKVALCIPLSNNCQWYQKTRGLKQKRK